MFGSLSEQEDVGYYSAKHFTFLLFKEDVVVTLIRIVDDEFQSLLGVYFFILWTSTSLRVVV